MKRRHKVVVEITTARPETAKYAVAKVRHMLSTYIKAHEPQNVVKIATKEYDRVSRADQCRKYGCNPLQHSLDCPKHKPSL